MTTKTAKRTTDHLDDLAAVATMANLLSLTAIRDQLPSLIAKAEKEGLSYTDFVSQMLRHECDTRRSRRLTRNIRRSGLPAVIEGLDDFDFSVRPKLEARVIRELLNCRWIEEGGRNIICVGRPGQGKTRLLDALGEAACLRGYSVLKVNTAEMLEDLHASEADATFQKTFRRYEKVDVLLLDEFGYAPIDSTATQYLFRLVSARHQRRSIALAANTGFANWKSFFPSEAQAVATVDRLIDRATILRFSGKGFRAPKEVLGAEDET